MPDPQAKRPVPKRGLAAVVGVSTAALLFSWVPKFEGTSLKTYRDPIGILTYCTGETKGAVWGRTYTPAQCRDQLDTTLLNTAEGIDGCVNAPLTSGQRAAAVSFAYNIGVARFCGSSVARDFNERRYAQACASLSQWVYAGGRVLPGLVNRRRIERQICEGKIVTSSS